MATAAVAFEIRCTNCYQSIRIPASCAGQVIACPNCKFQAAAPATSSDQTGGSHVLPATNLHQFAATPSATKSPAELREAAKRAAKTRSANSSGSSKRISNPERITAGRLSRLAAFLLDMSLFSLTYLLGIVPIIVLFVTEAVNKPTILRFVDFMCFDVRVAMATQNYEHVQRSIKYFSPEFWTVAAAWHSVVCLTLLWQCYSIATKGQTLGKRFMNIQIVDDDGFVPGFGRGVLLRSLPVWALYIAAFYVCGGFLASGLKLLLAVNFMMMVVSPPRCFHDLLAGTYVITR